MEPIYTQTNTKKEIIRLSLKPHSSFDGVKVGIRKDGKTYSVRDDRSRYFKPQEWDQFIKQIKEDKQFLFETCLMTGGRIEEIMNIRVDDVTVESRTLRLRITKKKAAKGERIGKRREFKVSSRYIRSFKAYIKQNTLNQTDYLFIPTIEFNAIVEEAARKKYVKGKIIAVFQMFKRGMKNSGIIDWYAFSLHNIRKTHGMWLKACIPYSRGFLDMGEICMRLGHDFNTYIKHYGSPSVFSERDIQLIKDYLGDIYGLN